MKTRDQSCVNNSATVYKQSSRWTVLGLAAFYGRLDIIQVLLGPSVRDFPDTAQGRQLASLAKQMDGLPPCNINEYNGDGYTALILAAKNNHLDICNCLLENGADVNTPMAVTGVTALAIAIEVGNIRLADLFLEHKANVNTFDNVRSTPLYAAVRLQNLYIVNKLLNNGADPNIGSQDHTPMFLAARLGLVEIAELLYQSGCDINVTSAHGITPLHEACIKGQEAMVGYLISKGCDINKADDELRSPLYSASKNGDVGICKLLINAGGDKHKITAEKNPLLVALSNGRPSVAELLLSSGMEIGSAVHYRISLKQMILENHRQTAAVLISSCSDLDLSGCLDQHYYDKDGFYRQNMFWADHHLLRMLLLSEIKGGNLIVKQMDLKGNNSCDDVNFLRTYSNSPLSLQELSRIRIRQCLGNQVVARAEKLSYLPPMLKRYVTLKLL